MRVFSADYANFVFRSSDWLWKVAAVVLWLLWTLCYVGPLILLLLLTLGMDRLQAPTENQMIARALAREYPAARHEWVVRTEDGRLTRGDYRKVVKAAKHAYGAKR